MNSLEKLIETFQESENICEFRMPVGEEKIVFVHDCYVKKYGKVFEFSDEEYQILTSLINKSQIPPSSYQFVAAVKAFNVSEEDISTKDLKEYRVALEEDLAAIQPDLVIPLGNLALKTLTKKSGIGNKRGREFKVQLEDEDETCIPVVPSFHPFTLYAEPKVRDLFIQDLDNAYAKFILKVNKFDDSPYELINGDIAKFDELMDECFKVDAVSFDLETEGLDFQKHKLLTCGFSYKDNHSFVFPVFHKEGEWTPVELEHIKDRCGKLMADPDIVKIAHNMKFDYKFLRQWGLTDFNNFEDSQIIHSLLDENKPHALKDLTKEYFPKELDVY
jgi:uracil-DNA glycosylase family 4